MVRQYRNQSISFLPYANATSSIQQAHLANFIPKVSGNDVRRLLDTDAVFIDARYSRDFEAGHLQGAINISVAADDRQRHEAMTGIGKNSRIVVYCQSAGCGFAEKVASKLLSDGFSNVSIFKGGWRQWQAKNAD